MKPEKIGILGLGYVGLPLCLQFASKGITVLGLDVDAAKVDAINASQSYIKHISNEALKTVVERGKLSATTDFSKVIDLDAVLICVPTPLDQHRDPDISYVLESGKAIAPYLAAKDRQQRKLIVLESTTYPGTTDTELCAVLEAGSGLEAGKDFHLAYSPEREDPGRTDHSVKTIPKVMPATL